MAINTIPISARTLPYETTAAANGSYTLPRYAFIPHPSLQQLSGGTVNSPSLYGIQAADYAVPPSLQRPYPTPYYSGLYGVRSLQVKASP